MIRIQSTKFITNGQEAPSEAWGFLIWDELSSTYIIAEAKVPTEPLDIFEYCLKFSDDNKNSVFGAMFDEVEESEDGILINGELLGWDALKEVL